MINWLNQHVTRNKKKTKSGMFFEKGLEERVTKYFLVFLDNLGQMSKVNSKFWFFMSSASY